MSPTPRNQDRVEESEDSCGAMPMKAKLKITLGLASTRFVKFPVCLALLVPFLVCPAPPPRIQGKITACFQGKIFPVRHMPVYVMTMKESTRLREVIKEYETLPPDPLERGPLQDKLDLKLITALRALPKTVKKAKTDESGHYLSADLHLAEDYFVLAFSPEGSEEFEFDTGTANKLAPGTTTVDLGFGFAADNSCPAPAR